MRERDLIALLMAALIPIIGCRVPTTTSCPNCMNVKPAYYNRDKAREAQRMTKRANKHSATGTVIVMEPTGTDKKTLRAQRRHRNKDAEMKSQNGPIL